MLLDVRRAMRSGAEAIAERQRHRLAQIVSHARAHSPYFREFYKDVPTTVEHPIALQVTDKKMLMSRFDEWATDRDVTLDQARAFASNPELIGERFLGKHTLATTTGTPGIFITDDGAMRVTSAMMLRVLRSWLGVGDLARIVAGGRRLAMVADVGHHSATSARYDLGDSVIERPDPCPCGNPLPAIRVQGRSADVLTFRTDQGESVAIAPLAFEIDHIPALELFQVVQTSPTNLRVRLLPAAGAEADRIWLEAQAEMGRLLSEHRLGHVTVERAAEPPQQGTGGKFRTVIPFPPAQPARHREERQA